MSASTARSTEVHEGKHKEPKHSEHFEGKQKDREVSEEYHERKHKHEDEQEDWEDPEKRLEGKQKEREEDIPVRESEVIEEHEIGSPKEHHEEIQKEEMMGGQKIGMGAEETELSEERQLASKIAYIVRDALDRVKPITDRITSNLDIAKAGKGEVNEEQLVQNIRPLIEQATQILNETHGSIKALDPDGKISERAKSAAKTDKASPEEYYLAQQLTELTEHVQKVIDKARIAIQDMPHAKEEIGPLLDMLQAPLTQILGAVGLLLGGVLGLVRNLLTGLGLGGVLDSLLSSLGLDKLLDGITDALSKGLSGLFK